jgi:hypothetical protein
MKPNFSAMWSFKHSTVQLTDLAAQPEYKDYFFNTLYQIVRKHENVHALFEALKAQNPNFHYIKESSKSLVIWEYSAPRYNHPDFKPRAFARIEFG